MTGISSCTVPVFTHCWMNSTALERGTYLLPGNWKKYPVLLLCYFVLFELKHVASGWLVVPFVSVCKKIYS